MDKSTFPFEVDATTDVPLWVQLRQRLIYLINSGYFKPGDRCRRCVGWRPTFPSTTTR